MKQEERNTDWNKRILSLGIGLPHEVLFGKNSSQKSLKLFSKVFFKISLSKIEKSLLFYIY